MCGVSWKHPTNGDFHERPHSPEVGPQGYSEPHLSTNSALSNGMSAKLLVRSCNFVRPFMEEIFPPNTAQIH